MSSSFGKILKVQLFGESHGEAIGAVMEGLPSGMKLDEELIQSILQRRAGKGGLTTERREADAYRIVSGYYRGKTTGMPLCVFFENHSSCSADYDFLQTAPRPGHADYPASVRSQGYDDLRGGGHHSGRMTLPYCFCGAIAVQVLRKMNISVASHLSVVGGIQDAPIESTAPDMVRLMDCSRRALPMLDEKRAQQAAMLIEKAKLEGSSIGAQVECAVTGMPVGIGEPFFDSIESLCSHALFSIPGVKAVAFGDAEVYRLRGETYNDCYQADENRLRCKTNHAGGIVGGYTNGMPITVKVDFRPTASIAKKQMTAAWNGEETVLQISGRHDPCIALRAAPAVECAMAFTLLDLLMMSSRYRKHDWME